MNLRERVLHLNKVSGLDLTVKNLQYVYKLYGVRMKKIRRILPSLGEISPLRRLQVSKLKAEVLSRMRRGHSIIYVDEACFSAKSNKEQCWQPPGENQFLNLTDLDQRCVACIAAVELRTGKLHSRETLTALQHTDVISFLSELDIILRRKKHV